MSLPLSVTAERENVLFAIDQARRTEINFPLKQASGLIEGKLLVKNLKGETFFKSNVIISIFDINTGKEAAYTYTDLDSNFTLSEIPSGNYKIVIDKSSQIKNKLNPIIHEIPVTIQVVTGDEFFEIHNIQLEALETIYGDV